MLDKSIKLWDPESGMEEVQHIFCLADQLIKRWKMDWNGMHGESFTQPDFDQQMRTLLQHFLQIAGIGFSYVAFEKVKFDDNEKNTLFEYKNLITQKSFQFYQKALYKFHAACTRKEKPFAAKDLNKTYVGFGYSHLEI